MGDLRYLLVSATPLLIGMLIAVLYGRHSRSQNRLQLAGYGLFLGLLTATALLRLLDALQLSFEAKTFVGVGLLVAGSISVCLRFSVPQTAAENRPAALGLSTPWETLFAVVCLVLLLARFVVLAEEALVRPLSGWDVTMHWATKAKVWFDQGAMAPFVDNERWLSAGAGVFTDHHADYPATVPLLQVWMSVANAAWSDSGIGLPWVIAGVALLLLFYGGALTAGVSPAVAAAFSYLLGSLPLVNTHIAIVGYADLLLGICYLAALQALFSWSRDRDRASLLLAVMFSLAAPLIKNEGFFWSATLITGLLVVLLPMNRLVPLLVAALFAVVLLFWLIPGDFRLAGHSIEGLQLGLRDGAAGALAQHFFVFGSWHLLGVLVLLLLLVAVRYPALLDGFGVLVLPLLTALALYLVLFTATRFSYGAIHGSASNRIALHLVPAFLFLAMLVAYRYLYPPRSHPQNAAS